jgi:hypothetical protein
MCIEVVQQRMRTARKLITCGGVDIAQIAGRELLLSSTEISMPKSLFWFDG